MADIEQLEQLAQLRVGSTLRGKYRLDRLLGVGGMAAVYAATHRVGNRVALKVLHPHMSTNADVRARFLREGYVANAVEHRGAVRVLDDDAAEDGSVFLAMELLDGETLDGRWRRCGERLPVAEVAELTWQLLDVLAAAHAKGVVHRDIAPSPSAGMSAVKPENVFLTREGVVKVLDFGIARLAGAAAPMAATRTGRMLGSPAFMGPEQALGLNREVDGQSDLWSVGATMFTLISGHYVHEAETVESMVVYTGSRPARSIREVAMVPGGIAAVVDHALAFHKSERWASAVAMQAGLAAAYRDAFGAELTALPAPARDSGIALGDSRVSGEAATLARPSAAPGDLGPMQVVGVTQPQRPVFLSVARTEDVTDVVPNPLLARPRSPSTTAGLSEPSGEVLVIPGVGSRSRGVVVAGAIAAVLAAGGVSVFALRGASAVATSGPAATVAPQAATTSAAPSHSTTSLAPQPPEVSVADLPLAPPTTARPAAPAPPLVRPPGAARAPSATASVAPPAPAPAAPKPDCSPNYTFDQGGNKVFKPECFLPNGAAP